MDAVTSTWWPVTLSCIGVSFTDLFYLRLHRLHLFQPRSAALIGGRYSHRFAVFRNGAARYGDTFPGQQLRDTTVAQRVFRILFLDELANLGANGLRGGARG